MEIISSLRTSLAGKTVVITGASSGVGLATAEGSLSFICDVKKKAH